jgi:hypothetical protein
MAFTEKLLTSQPAFDAAGRRFKRYDAMASGYTR